jgi:hypothetical protein
MGLRCTVIGHDHGEPQRVEEREDRGDELVVTVREYRECRRCGHRKTISENTEVRSGDIHDADDPVETSETAETGQTAPPPGSGEPPEQPPDTGVDPDPTPDPTVGNASTEGSSGHDPIDPLGSVETADGDKEGMTATDDDGIILEDDTDGGDDDGREHGEWPDDDADTDPTRTGADDDDGSDDADHGGWPTPDAEDQGYDAAPSAAGSDDDQEFVGDLTTEESEASTGESIPDETAPGEDAANRPTDDAPRTGQSDSSPAARRSTSSVGSVLSCPSCGTTTSSQGAPLRPGDICPQCGQGYLTERQE